MHGVALALLPVIHSPDDVFHRLCQRLALGPSGRSQNAEYRIAAVNRCLYGLYIVEFGMHDGEIGVIKSRLSRVSGYSSDYVSARKRLPDK